MSLSDRRLSLRRPLAEPWCCVGCQREAHIYARGDLDDPEPPACSGCGKDMWSGRLTDYPQDEEEVGRG